MLGKLRVWDNNFKKILYVVEVDWAPSNLKYSGAKALIPVYVRATNWDDSGEVYHYYEAEVSKYLNNNFMQEYIFSHDNKDNLIFENDILKNKITGKEYILKCNTKYGWQLTRKNKSFSAVTENFAKDYTVVGNIYTNLLN